MVIISTLLPKPEPAIDSTDSVLSMFSLPEMIKQGSFIQLGSYAFERKYFLWIDLINHTDPICNHE